MDGAHKVFMDLGFDGASMGEIARVAGVSKGTLYVYFADKSQLFGAVVEREAIEQGKVKFDLSPGRDAETTLREFGQAYIEIVCRPQGGSAIRTVMAIAERMPDVGRQYYDHVIDRTTRQLAAWLDSEVAGERLVDRRHLPRGPAIHAGLPGDAVPAIHPAGGARALARRRSRRSSTAQRRCFWRRIGCRPQTIAYDPILSRRCAMRARDDGPHRL